MRQGLTQGRRRRERNGHDSITGGRLKRPRPASTDFWVQTLKPEVVERVNDSAHVRFVGLADQRDLVHGRVHHRRHQNLRTLAQPLPARLSKVRQKLNLVFTGPTGIGKSWLACALAQKACREGFSVLHKKTSELFRELAVAHADGSLGRMLLRLAQIDVLLLDDFAMAPLKDSERRDFLEVCDDRYQHRSMILTSQMPVAHWHEQIGDPTVADSILDRLLHNAYRIELKGESIRKTLGRKPDQEDGQ